MYHILHVVSGEYLYEDATFDILTLGYSDNCKVIEHRFKFFISRKLNSLMDKDTNKLYPYNYSYTYHERIFGISREEFEIVKV